MLKDLCCGCLNINDQDIGVNKVEAAIIWICCTVRTHAEWHQKCLSHGSLGCVGSVVILVSFFASVKALLVWRRAIVHAKIFGPFNSVGTSTRLCCNQPPFCAIWIVAQILFTALVACATITLRNTLLISLHPLAPQNSLASNSHLT